MKVNGNSLLISRAPVQASSALLISINERSIATLKIVAGSIIKSFKIAGTSRLDLENGNG